MVREVSPPTTVATAQLTRQHSQLWDLFDRTVHARGLQRQTAYKRLQFGLSIHEAVEGLIVHPAVLREHPSEAAALVSRRLEEERDILLHLDRLEGSWVTSEAFATDLLDLRTTSLNHNELEELHEFPLLGPLDEEAMDLLVRVTERLQGLCG